MHIYFNNPNLNNIVSVILEGTDVGFGNTYVNNSNNIASVILEKLFNTLVWYNQRRNALSEYLNIEVHQHHLVNND